MTRKCGLTVLIFMLLPAAAMAQTPAVVQQAGAALDEIFHNIGQILTPERQNELLVPDSAKVSQELLDQYKRIDSEVISPLVNAGLSCAEMPSAQAVILRVAAESERLTSGTPASVEQAMAQLNPTSKKCEEEAKAKCKAAENPDILVKFWQQGYSYEALNKQDAILRKRAQRICAPKSYKISGNAGPMKVEGTACDLDKPFTVSGGGGGMTVKFSYAPGNDEGGSVSYTGGAPRFPMSGAGSYTVTADEKGGTLKQTHTGKVNIPMGGSATHTDILKLTPIPKC